MLNNNLFAIVIDLGDASKAAKELDWTPKVTFKELVKIMALADWDLVSNKEQSYY